MCKSILFKRNQLGFTLVELLVVVGIIGLLSAVVLLSVSDARKNASVKAETATVAQFKLWIKLYEEIHSDFPPSSDVCSICDLANDDIAGAATKWNTVADSLVDSSITQNPLYTDDWGNPYGYDNNRPPHPDSSYYTILCSMGPDETLQTFLPGERDLYLRTVSDPQAQGDDICIFI